MIKYDGTSRSNAVLDEYDSRGYALQFEALMETVRQNLPVQEIIEGGLREVRPVYPPPALREFIANALVHQDLTIDGVQLTVEIFDDRVEICNPGTPLIPVERFVDETRTRNQELSDLMRMARICEARGSGVDRALESIEDALRPAPKFETGTHSLTVVLSGENSFESMPPEDRAWAIYLHVCLCYSRRKQANNGSMRQRFGLPQSKSTVVSQAISTAIDLGLILYDPAAGGSKRLARYIPFYADPGPLRRV